MKVTFIYPKFEKFLESVEKMSSEREFFTVGKFTCPPSLGIPILASVTPGDVEINFVDDNAGEKIDFDDGTDIYAINSFTPQGTRALEIAAECKARGKTVVAGGMFPSFMSEEFSGLVDSVCIGEGEYTWGELLSDYKNGCLKPVYKSSKPVDMAAMPEPRRDIFYNKTCYDWDEDLIQLTRGCLYNCAMCIIPRHMGTRLRFKPIDMAVREISHLKFENVYLTDDSLFFPHRNVREYAEAFFRAVEPLGKKFFVSSTLALNSETSFLDLAARAGVRNFYCTLNVDPLSIKLLRGDKVARAKFKALVEELKSRDINFFASFGIGRDWDDDSIADRVLELCEFAGITTSEFFIFSPYPGSAHWDRLSSQNRIISRQWHKYNGANVVFKPAKMSEDKLYERFVDCWKGFYEMNSKRNLAHMEPSVWVGDEMTVSKSLKKKGVEREAAITGISIISPLGNDTATVLKALRDCRDGISAATKIDTSKFSSHLCAEVKGFDYSSNMSAVELEEYTDPYIRMAINGARMALADAGLDFSKVEKAAVVLATCNAGLNSGEVEYLKKYGFDCPEFDRSVSLQSEFYSLSKAVAGALKSPAQCWMVNTACSGSTAAIGLAEALIESGKCDVVLVGGADAVALSNYAGFSAIKVVSAEKIAPFSTPVGLNIGEGAAFWVLENHAKALLRKAKCYGKVIGHATTGDAHHPTQPDPRGDGAYRTMRNAVRNAGLDVSDIGCINAHGSGTAANDRSESKGIAKFCGQTQIPVTSTKSYMGHCMGATGILEATCQLISMNDNFIPPTLRNSGARAGCEITAVGGRGIQKNYDCFLSANYAFAGNNAAIVVAKRDFVKYEKTPASGKKRPVISGLGGISALGAGISENLANLRAGKVGIEKIKRFDSPRMAGMVELPNLRTFDRRLDFSGMNRISSYATITAKCALDSAKFAVKRDNCEDIGLAVSVCRGSSETAHMDSVFGDENHRGDIGCFSNVTANSTAGWVSKALEIKGTNITLTPGPNGGLQSLAFASDVISDAAAKQMLALAADEIYKQEIDGYDIIGNLRSGKEESNFKLNYDSDFKTVMGEGAAAVLIEDIQTASERGAYIYGEILGFGSAMDIDGFTGANLGSEGLKKAVAQALEFSGVKSSEIDLILWSPRGCAQDAKFVALRDALFPGLPMVTTVFNTGYVETSSSLLTLACVLKALSEGEQLWPQRSGVKALDDVPVPENPKRILCVASSHIGNNYAAIIGRQ